MSGNFANTTFVNSLKNEIYRLNRLNGEIRPEGQMTAVSGQTVDYHVNDPWNNPSNNYVLYLPVLGSLSGTEGPNDTSATPTVIEISNPKGIFVELRSGDYYTGSPTPTISTNSHPDFSSLNSTATHNDNTITFAIYTDPSNPSQTAWFKV